MRISVADGAVEEGNEYLGKIRWFFPFAFVSLNRRPFAERILRRSLTYASSPNVSLSQNTSSPLRALMPLKWYVVLRAPFESLFSELPLNDHTGSDDE